MNLKEAIIILGLKAPFSATIAKIAYRKLALKYHPDKGGSVDKMQILNEAYRLCCKGVMWRGAPLIEMEFKTIKHKPNLHSVVSWFGERMLKKLETKNRKENAKRLYGRLISKCVELRKAIREKNKEDIINECANVADFAMMIADKARKLL